MRAKPAEVHRLIDGLDGIERRLEAAAAKLAAKLAGLDRRLPREVLRTEESRLRREAVAALGADLQAAGEVRAALESQEVYYNASALRYGAAYHSDPVTAAHLETAWLGRLAAAGPAELLELARLSAADGALAKSVAVAREATRRADLPRDLAASISREADKVPLDPADTGVLRALGEGRRRIESLALRAVELERGRVDPSARIAAAYGAGPAMPAPAAAETAPAAKVAGAYAPPAPAA